MSLIPINTLSGICDRIAGQVTLLKFAINSGQSFGQRFYPRIHNGLNNPSGDYSIEGPTIGDAYALDNNSISGSLLKTVFSPLLQDLQTQVTNNGAASFDSFLTISGGLGAGVHVSPPFEDAWFQCIGTHLSAVNVFFQDANILVCSYQPTGSGTGIFTHNQTIGTGTGTNYTPGVINYAPARMVIVPISNVNAPIQLSLQLSTQNPAGGTGIASYNVFISGIGSALSGIQFPVSNVSGQFLDVTNIVAAGGVSVDTTYRVYALQERGGTTL